MSVTVSEVWEALTPEEREGAELLPNEIRTTRGDCIARAIGDVFVVSGYCGTREKETAEVLTSVAIVDARDRQKRSEIVAALDEFSSNATSDEDEGVCLVLPIRDVEHARAVVRALRGVEVDGG